MTDEIKLEPCPFCGGNATIMGENGGEFAIKTVVCMRCGIGFDRLGAGCHVDVQVEHWNKRALPRGSGDAALRDIISKFYGRNFADLSVNLQSQIASIAMGEDGYLAAALAAPPDTEENDDR